MDRLDELQINQLDRTLAPFSALRNRTVPHVGWVKTIREALGMSIRQLAKRTELSKTSIASAESNEAKGSIKLDSLQRLAHGLDCELVYALVPRESLRYTLKKQVERKAEILVGSVSDSMDLEAQGVSDKERQRQLEEIADEILNNRGRGFWDV